jgi:hypothetical protein
MRGERGLLRIGDYLIGRASRLLPGEIRDERRREWTAELPAILRDPDIRWPACRAARMLRYAAGTVWGTALSPGCARGRLTAVMAVVAGLLTNVLVLLPIGIHGLVTASEDWVPYCWISVSDNFLIGLAWVLARRRRRAAKPMEGVRDGVLAYGAMIIPGFLLTLLLRVVGADRSDLPSQTGPPSPPAPGPAATAEQAISAATQTVGCFYRVRWRPGYQVAEVDEFIMRIEATLAGGTRPGQAVTAAQVEAVKFGTTWRGGYDEMVVDQALDHYADALAKLYPRAPLRSKPQ